MILEKQKEASIIVDGEVSDSIGMSLDLDSAQVLMQMLSKNLYSDSIGSTIRECASNALDSHRRANVKDPIVVSLIMDNNNNYEFSVEDFGIGLDADDVKNIISKYGKSTKRLSNNELGMMGLGFKAPLAYSSSFYFICRKDGIERKYMMYEGEDLNTIDLLYENSTNERNGVKVIIPVKFSDRHEFYKKTKEQLAYFENVYFNVSVGSDYISNDFKIHRGEHFQYSEISSDSYLHICLDNVYYPIDFKKLNIDYPISFPVGLRFSLTDGIFPTPNRESIRYTQEAKNKIADKIKLISDYFIKKYNDQITNSETFIDVFNYYNSSSKYVEVIPSVKLNVSNLKKYTTIDLKDPKLKYVKHLDLSQLCLSGKHEILTEYKITNILHKNKIRETNGYYESRLDVQSLSNVYLYESKIPEKVKLYLKSKYSNDKINFAKKHRSLKLFSKFDQCYYELLKLKSINRKYWREAIVEFQKIIEELVSNLTNINDVIIPEHFLNSIKKTKNVSRAERYKKAKGEINVKVATPLEKNIDGKNCKFVPDIWSLEKIDSTSKSLVIYSHHDNSLKLDRLYAMTNNLQKIKYITLSTREIKILESSNIKNVISYENFMKGDTKPFKRLATAYLIKMLINSNSETFKRKLAISEISESLSEKLIKLETYANNNYKHLHNNDVIDILMKHAEENNLFDHSIYGEYLEVKNTLSKLYFLNYLIQKFNRNYYYSNNTFDKLEKQILIDLFKRNNEKVNLENYNLVVEKELVEL